MIKIGIRKNLICPLLLFIFSFSRQIVSIIMDEIFNFGGSLLLTLIMFLSEIISGLILYLSNIVFLHRKQEKSFMGIKLVQAPSNISHPDNNFKIYMLIIEAGFFDFIQFILGTYYLPKINNDLTSSLDIHLRSTLIL